MNKMIKKPTTSDRETKITNIMLNTSIILMATLTDAFSSMFTEMAKTMTEAVSTSVGVPQETTKNMDKKIDTMKTELPQQLLKELQTMKHDLHNQIQTKKQDIETLLTDPAFDKGITIAEHYDFHLPAFTQDLDEKTLFAYITLLKTNDPKFTQMFQELMEWMRNLPQPK
jgi:hypothetical protein